MAALAPAPWEPVPSRGLPFTAPADEPAHSMRARILKTAEECFLNQGFSRVTMDDMALSLGISKKTLYVYYPGKDDLLKAMLLNRLRGIHRNLEQIINEPAANLINKLKAVVRFLTRRHSEVKPPFFFDLKRHAPEAFQWVEDYRQRAIPAVFGRLLEEGRREQMIRKDLPAPLVIEVLLASVQIMINPDVLTRLGLSLDISFETILDVVFNGIMTPEGKRAYDKIQA